MSGVDLAPIKPIPRVTTFAADITTIHRRNLIRNELKYWKADAVPYDGAPNVGNTWIQDAYYQSEFVLMSLKLAVELLMKGGTFSWRYFEVITTTTCSQPSGLYLQSNSERARAETPQAQSLREEIHSEQPEGPQVRTTSLLTATHATRACAPSPPTRPLRFGKDLSRGAIHADKVSPVRPRG